MLLSFCGDMLQTRCRHGFVFFVLDSDHSKKKAVIVTARVHPGETNSSWMMKGLLDYVTGTTITAKVWCVLHN